MAISPSSHCFEVWGGGASMRDEGRIVKTFRPLYSHKIWYCARFALRSKPWPQDFVRNQQMQRRPRPLATAATAAACVARCHTLTSLCAARAAGRPGWVLAREPPPQPVDALGGGCPFGGAGRGPSSADRLLGLQEPETGLSSESSPLQLADAAKLLPSHSFHAELNAAIIKLLHNHR